MSLADAALDEPAGAPAGAPLRLGFLGVGWIGRHRMEALLTGGLAQAAAVADPSPRCLEAALALAPGAAVAEGLDDLFESNLDGVVIATPSAQHAAQAVRALEAGVPVFCQKPLGRTAAEVRSVVDAARRHDRLLGVDLSYRFTEGARRIRDLVRAGELGEIFAADLVFHNAYGPDKDWFYDATSSGGGCVMDLGVHLVDLALWTLDFPAVARVSSHLRAGGRPLARAPEAVEDFAAATVELANGAIVRIGCSWRLHAGQPAQISAAFYGTRGGAELRNVAGSFYDFAADRFCGIARTPLATTPDDWGGRAALSWAHRLATSPAWDPGCERLVEVAEVLDRIYGR